MTDDLLLPRHPAAPAPEPLRFTGTGAEYFRIWIVNLLLTIVTLGIYSAWAKVRRLQYFHRHTQLAGSGFDYHGRPAAILKGRAVAFGALVLYKIADEMHPDAALPRWNAVISRWATGASAPSVASAASGQSRKVR